MLIQLYLFSIKSQCIEDNRLPVIVMKPTSGKNRKTVTLNLQVINHNNNFIGSSDRMYEIVYSL